MIRLRSWRARLLPLLAAGCGDDPVELPNQDWITVAIQQEEVVFRWLRAEAELTAIAEMPVGPKLIWTSSDESVATVAPGPTMNDDSVVRVTSKGVGRAFVTVTVQGTNARDSVLVRVEPGQAAEIGFSALVGFDTLRSLGDTTRLTGRAYDAAGRLIASGSGFTWATSADTVATVDGTGLVTAVGNGRAAITAAALGGTGEVTVTVAQRAVEFREMSPSEVVLRSLGDTVRMAVDAVDANGHAIKTAAVFAWTSSDETVATVDRTGLVTAAGSGSARIRAASGFVSGTAALTVAQEIAGVRMTPAKDTLRAPGETVRLVAEAADANGFPVADAGLVFDWSSSDETVATVDGAGLVTAVAEGIVEIRARSAGPSGVTDLLVWFPSDRDILVALYDATNGPFWSHSDNWLTDAPLDSWHGVDTDAAGRVVRLDFRQWRNSLSSANNALLGSIPVELGYLSELRELNLSGNALTGPIPRELGKLANLESLSLSYNYLAGGIPAQLGELTQLRELHLRRSGLTGPIPAELGRLADLRVVVLSENELSGPIPQSFAGLSRLRTLDLHDNRLSGPIPPEVGTLANLEVLGLGQNPDLTGEIPVEFGNLANLRTLNLTSYACCPQFTGTVPRELGSLSELRHLELGYNRLTGTIPPELANLTNLETLELHFSDLTGTIPTSLGGLQYLQRLYLPRNELSGPIPPEFGGLSDLEELVLWGNSLEGSMPPELGDLANLRYLLLTSNELSGPLPPQWGNLRRLELLTVAANDLSGPIPLEYVNLPLSRFEWGDSGLCAPLDAGFQAWLETIREMEGGPGCVTDALAALYRATGGTGWTNAANWLSDEPVSRWQGVATDDEGRITGLNLRGNGLAGTVPPEVGALANLTHLDLGDNELAGAVPAELGELRELRELYLSGNRFEGRLPGQLGDLSELTTLDVANNRFTGALPSSLAGLSKLADFQWNASGLCAPAVDWYQAWLGAIASHSAGTDCSPALRLSVRGAHVNQAAQDLVGSVPLIAGREGLLRVFLTADQANDYRPDAEALFFLNGRQVHRAEMELRSDRGIPEDAISGHPDQSLLAEIPGEILVPGVEVVVEADPDSIVPRAAGSVARFPAQGRLELDVQEMPRMELTVVPALTVEEPDSSVLDWASELGPGHSTIEYVTHVLPVGEYAVNVREPLIRAEAPNEYDGWRYFLEEINLLRAMDGGRGYYFGVIGGSGVGTVGIASSFLGVGRLHREIDHIMAHELGHAMYLFWHAPCGLGPAYNTADPNYPYPDGSIGVWGYDARSRILVPPSTPDVMGYCRPFWISDYHFEGALRNRLRRENRPPSRATVADGVQRLLLWGGVSPENELRLNPAFALDMPEQLPVRAGPYRLEGFGSDGGREFSLDFDMDELSHGGGHFLFAIPFEEGRMRSLARIVLTGPEGGTLELNDASEQPMALVLDRETGSLRSVLRGEAAVGAMATAAAETSGTGADRGSNTRVLVGYGMPPNYD